MKSVVNLFLKEKLKYTIFTILSSFFISYLLIRINNYSSMINVCITLTTLLFMFTLYLYFSKFDYRINKKEKIKGILISTSVSLIAIICFRSIFLYSYKDSTIIIEKQVANIEKIDFIDSIIINNVKYIKNGEFFVNTFSYDKNKNFDFEFSDQQLKINIAKSKDVKIVFNTLKKIKIRDNNKIVEISNDTDKEYTYTINGNKYMSLENIFITIVGFVIIFVYAYAFYKFLINKNNNYKNKILIITLLIVAFIGVYYYHNSIQNILYNDSESYINFDFKSFFKLEFDGRTPIYPAIIRINKIIFGDNYLKFICIFQYIIWFISIYYLFKIIRLLTKNDKLASIGTILYAVSPTIIAWNNIILTESLALSGTLIFIYYIIKYIIKNKLIDGVLSIIISVVLTFHRPTSIIYLVFLIIFFIVKLIFESDNRRQNLKCTIISFIGVLLVFVYAIIFNRTFQIYSISDAVPRQDLYISIQEKYYKDGNNENIIKIIDETLEKYPNEIWSAIEEVKKEYNLKEIKEFTSYARKENAKNYIVYLIDLIFSHIPVKFTGYSYFSVNNNNILYQHIPSLFSIITFGHVYLIIIVCLVFLIIDWIKTKRIPYIFGGLFSFPLVIVISSFIGTCGEFMRTAICAVPFTYISIILLLNKINKEKESN